MSSACPHTSTALLKLDTGAGGIQYRRYCTTCWRDTCGAIPHARAHEMERRQGFEAPLADLEFIYAAGSAYRKKMWRHCDV
jgi:hypothetical protein